LVIQRARGAKEVGNEGRNPMSWIQSYAYCSGIFRSTTVKLGMFRPLFIESILNEYRLTLQNPLRYDAVLLRTPSS